MDPQVAKAWNRAMRYIRLEAEQGSKGRIDSVTACKNILFMAEESLRTLAESEDNYLDETVHTG